MKVINRIIVTSILTMTLLVYQGVGYAGGPKFDFEFTGKLPGALVEENQPIGTEVIRLSATDPDGDSLIFHLLGGGADLSENDGHGAFTVEGDGNVAVIKTRVILDYETQDAYLLGVMLEDETGDFGGTLYVVIRVKNDPSDDDTNTANSSPEFDEGESATRSIAEDAPPGTNIGLPITATDPDDDPPSYSMWYNDAYGFIELDRNTGQLRVGPNGLDYETQSSYEVRMFAEDGKGGSARIDVTIEITDVAVEGQPRFQLGRGNARIPNQQDPKTVPQDTTNPETVPQDTTNPVPTQQESRVVPESSVKQPKPKSTSLRPSPVAQDRIIFNEIRNATDDTNDWLEIRNISDTDIPLNDWEITIVTREGEKRNQDIDFVGFPEYTLPAGAILLIVNTDPSETSLVEGYNIEMPDAEQETAPLYLLEETFKLPSTPYLLILRSATDKNGLPEAFEDVMGNHFRVSRADNTQVWPLQGTARYDWLPSPLTQDEAWRRVDIEKRGYVKEAWALSGYQSGIGYEPSASVAMSLGTPGYPNSMIVDMSFASRITFSELMYATRGGLFSQSQWIELYNNTATAAESINLEGWKLVIEARDSETRHRYTEIALEALEVPSSETVLLITRDRRHSGHLSEDQVYDLYEHHGGAFNLGLRENAVLSSSGFSLQLFSPDGVLVDSAGNLDGERGVDTPLWELPSGWTEDGARTSLIRGYEDDVALNGTEATSWYRAVDGE